MLSLFYWCKLGYVIYIYLYLLNQTKTITIMTNLEITEMAKDLSTRSPYQIQQELFNILWLTRRDSKTEDFNILVKSIKENNKYDLGLSIRYSNDTSIG